MLGGLGSSVVSGSHVGSKNGGYSGGSSCGSCVFDDGLSVVIHGRSRHVDVENSRSGSHVSNGQADGLGSKNNGLLNKDDSLLDGSNKGGLDNGSGERTFKYPLLSTYKRAPVWPLHRDNHIHAMQKKEGIS